jgi:integrase
MAGNKVSTGTPGMYGRVGRRTIGGKPVTTYYGRVYVRAEGRSRYFRLGTSIKAAERKYHKLLGDPEAAVQQRQKVTDKARDGLTVAELYRDFTANYRGRGGTDYYVNVLKRMVASIGKVRVSDVTAATIDSYLRKRRAEKTKGVPRIVDGKRIMVRAGRRLAGESTLRKECIAAAKMFRWARGRGMTAVNPFADFDKPKEPRAAAARALTYDEEDSLLTALPPFERDVATWALDSGMRRGEILSLRWSCIDRAAGRIHVVETKTGKGRTVPLALSARLSAVLKRHPQRTTTDLLFHGREGKRLDADRINGLLESAMRKAGIPKIRGSLWGVLRKTWVSRIYANGALPQQEAEWGGHSMDVATRHYLDYSPAASAGADGLLDRPIRGAQGGARSKSGADSEAGESQ